MSQTRGDALVADYLDRVRAAAAGLDPGRREELIEDLREHIAAARAELSPETEAGVRTILDRLGDPAVIAAEAAVGEASVGEAPVPAAPAQPAPAQPAPAQPATSTKSVLTVLIVVLGLVFLVPVAVCLLGGLGLFVFRTAEPVENHGPVVEVPLPTPRPTEYTS